MEMTMSDIDVPIEKIPRPVIEALFDMCVQHCTYMPEDSLNKSDPSSCKFFHGFISCNEIAFGILGIVNGETVGEAARRIGYEFWY